jgi:hypothetical protein
LALGPKKTAPAETVGFRCPVELKQWMESRADDELTLSKVVAWVAEMGREYVETIEPLHERLEAVQREEAITRSQAVAKLLRLGLAAHDAPRKPPKK